jgi:putative DNA primase/helicase
LREFKELAIKSGLGELLNRVSNGYLESTPNGNHILYRSKEIGGNQKLASKFNPNTGETKTRIETRGEGGFLVVAPSSGYILKEGSFVRIPVKSAAHST